MKKVKLLSILFLLLVALCVLYNRLSNHSATLDKIYVINLDRSVERYQNIKQKLDELELPIAYTRFSAVDGRKIKLVNKDTKEIITGEETLTNEKLLNGNFDIICSDEYSGDFNQVRLENLVHFHPRTIGEVGIACSHKQIWQEIVQQGYKNVLILEDDASFNPGFKKNLKKLMDNLPNDYDLLYIYAHYSKNTFRIQGKNYLLQKVMRFIDENIKNRFVMQARKDIYTTTAYILSQEGAQKLLEGSKNFEQIDMVMSKLIENNKLTAYISKPLLVNVCTTSVSDKCQSDIGEFPNMQTSQDLKGE